MDLYICINFTLLSKIDFLNFPYTNITSTIAAFKKHIIGYPVVIVECEDPGLLCLERFGKNLVKCTPRDKVELVPKMYPIPGIGYILGQKKICLRHVLFLFIVESLFNNIWV